MSDYEEYELSFSTEDSDFKQGVEMGLNSMELISKLIETRSVKEEPIVLIGILTSLFNVMYQISTKKSVDDVIDICKNIAKDEADQMVEDDYDELENNTFH